MTVNKAKGGAFLAAFFLSFSVLAVDTEYESKVVFDSVSLVLAAENNASPSSMMGHSFLKISGGGRVHAFGYYAVLNDGFKSYIDALIGKQSGVYALSPYRAKAAEYLLSENRSLWEFDLDLSPVEKSVLKREILKLKGRSDAYSFASHNCSSAVENLLKSANSDYAFKRTKPFTTPVEYAQFLHRTGKIKKISHIRAPAQKNAPVKNISASAGKAAAFWKRASAAAQQKTAFRRMFCQSSARATANCSRALKPAACGVGRTRRNLSFPTKPPRIKRVLPLTPERKCTRIRNFTFNTTVSDRTERLPEWRCISDLNP